MLYESDQSLDAWLLLALRWSDSQIRSESPDSRESSTIGVPELNPFVANRASRGAKSCES